MLLYSESVYVAFFYVYSFIILHVCIWSMSSKILLFHGSVSGPSCSKLMMLLVNDSLKFTSSDTQICCNFLLKKCAVQKISEYCVLNPLKQLTK